MRLICPECRHIIYDDFNHKYHSKLGGYFFAWCSEKDKSVKIKIKEAKIK